MPLSSLCTLSATRLGRMIRAGTISSEEVVEAHLDQIERVNGALNAVVVPRFDAARQEARAADVRLRREGPRDLPPLHGVPCTIKECFGFAGHPNTSGLVARKGRLATRDATAVARLRAAGAIPLGLTNISELCMWMECTNRVYGRTGSAYAPDRTSGGSSGGEGAIVGAGGSPFGLGSDVGGSIRIPAFFSGVFGHKATGGLVPGTGQVPGATGPVLRYLATGPIARRAEDLEPIVRLLAGPDGEDTGCFEMELGDPASVDVRSLTVYIARDAATLSPDPELIVAMEGAAKALEKRGARIRECELPRLRSSIPIWSALMEAGGGPSFAELLGEGVPVPVGRELLRWALRRSPHTLPALGLALIEKIPKLLGTQSQRFIDEGATLRSEIVALLGDRGVLLYPPHARLAPRHNHALLPPLGWGYTAVFNVMETPVTQVPLGLSRAGLPLGVQVVGVHGNDHVTLAVALALEEELGGWVPPAWVQ